jgi:nicotinamide phosphoribosyltransferase
MPQLYIKDANGNFVEATEADCRPAHIICPPLTDNLVTDTDSYKWSFEEQFPDGMSSMYQYFEARGGEFHSTQAVGLQGFLKKRLVNPVTKAMVDEAEKLAMGHGEPFYRHGWDTIVDDYKGFCPITIRAVPEGSVFPTSNALFDVELTEPDPRIFWLPTHIETAIVRNWYSNAVGTTSIFCKKVILDALKQSSDDPMGEIMFKLHDFGSRGVSSEESARIGGAAHLANFLGTDTVEALRYLLHYYGCKGDMPGFSIPASEHSTRCAWGKDGEFAGYKKLVKKFLYDRQLPPGVPKIAACVSDTYDVFNAVENGWCGPELHEYVRDSGGKLVVRPDSGKPVEVLLKLLAIFDRKIGMRKNNKGYKVLPPYFGLIQGDGCNYDSIQEILHEVMAHGYSASNLAFGMGGGLLQLVNRDTSKYAYKASAGLLNGEWIDLFKDPITDPGKKSKRGHLALIQDGFGGPIRTVKGPRMDDMLKPVFRNGKLLKDYTLDEVRENATKAVLSL